MSESYFGLFGLEDERQAAMAEEATPKQVTTPENAEQILNSNACCICRSKQIKYRCPACGFRTCSADCVKQHKATFSCSGVRNKIPFVKISEYTENQFYDDYSFLEGTTQAIDNAHRAQRGIAQSLSELPKWLLKLRYEARCRGTRLKFLPAGFVKRRANKSTFMYKEKAIHWDIDWMFDGVKGDEETLTIHERRAPESRTLRELLDAYINPNDPFEKFDLTKKLLLFREQGELIALLKVEDGVFNISLDTTLKDALVGKTIIEYPTIIVTSKENEAKHIKATDAPPTPSEVTDRDIASQSADESDISFTASDDSLVKCIPLSPVRDVDPEMSQTAIEKTLPAQRAPYTNAVASQALLTDSSHATDSESDNDQNRVSLVPY